MQLPCEIAEAANGRDALEYLKEHTADILLTDVKMPFMDGIQLIEECKKDDRNEDMKCVIFSGCSEFDYARKAVRLGVSDYILKPVDPSEFKETITRVIQELEASIDRIRSIEHKTSELEKARNEIIDIIASLSIIAQQNADGTSQTNIAITDMADRFKNIEDSTENLRNTADMLADNISNFNI